MSTPTTVHAPHVIVVDDTSDMFGNVLRVHGPYPDKHAATMDRERVSSLYPRKVFCIVSPLLADVVLPPPAPPRKAKAGKRLVVADGVSIKGVPADQINAMVEQ